MPPFLGFSDALSLGWLGASHSGLLRSSSRSHQPCFTSDTRVPIRLCRQLHMPPGSAWHLAQSCKTESAASRCHCIGRQFRRLALDGSRKGGARVLICGKSIFLERRERPQSESLLLEEDEECCQKKREHMLRRLQFGLRVRGISS